MPQPYAGAMDLVVASLEAWDTVWRRNQHLISRLLRDDPALRVLFVEPAADPLHDLISRRPAGRGVPVMEVPGYERRLMRFRPVKRLPRRVDKRVDDRLAHAIMRAAVAARMQRPLLWVNDPGAATLARTSGWTTVYDITDDWVAAERAPASLARVAAAEKWLLLNAEAVVACSDELIRRKAPWRSPGAIDLIPNAVDVDAYRRPAPRPADLPQASAVYVGTLHTDRLDIGLCEMTARTLVGRGTLVLVGPSALSRVDTERLRDAGVLLLGPRPHERVIGYLQHADTLVVPHVVTAFTESLDPIKLYEYAAVGRPVISTPVAGFRDLDDPRVRVATPRDFPRAVASIVPTTTRFPVGADAPVPTWEDRAVEMRRVLARIAAIDDRL
jgi:glycosyltransferase involved in cell wall biosynthesis